MEALKDFRTRGLKSPDFFLVSPDLEMPSRAGPRTFSGVAYSGEVVTDQWFWDAVAFYLDGVKLSPERMPVLRDHDPGRILGYTTGFSKAGGLEVRGTFLEGSADAREVAAMADEGCPWRLSVHIVPDRLETLERGDRASVNGRGVARPLTIFRESAVREAGFRAVGADPGTGAAVFAVGKPGQQEVAVSGNNGRTRAEAAKAAEPPAASGGGRDLALKTLGDGKSRFAAGRGALEADKGRPAAEAAGARSRLESLDFELATVKDSLAKALSENGEPGRGRAGPTRA
jgi:hypothetical protein